MVTVSPAAYLFRFRQQGKLTRNIPSLAAGKPFHKSLEFAGPVG
jgi:hypothetical protein